MRAGQYHTEESKEKNRMAHKGKHHSEETILILRAKCRPPSRLGICPSEETLKKMCEAQTKRYENPKEHRKISEATKKRFEDPKEHKKVSDSNKGKHYASEETRKKMRETQKKVCNDPERRRKTSERQSGEKSNNWKGGISFEPYCFKFNNPRKRNTGNFFDDKCIVCGIHVDENLIKWNGGFKVIKLSIHHIDHDKEQGCNGKPFNLVPFCHSCHGKETHHKEEYRIYVNHTLQEGFKWGIWSEREYMEKVMYDE